MPRATQSRRSAASSALRAQGRSACASILIGSLMLAPALRTHAQSNMQIHKRFVCENGADIRTITVYTSKSGANGCRVEYRKNNVSRTVWSARADDTFCTPKAEEIVISLKASHHQCEDRSTADPGEDESLPADVLRNGLRAEAPSNAPSTESPRNAPSIGSARNAPSAAERGTALEWTRARIIAMRAKNSDLLKLQGAAVFPTAPDKVLSADLNGDGVRDIVLQWGWSHYQCDDDYLAVLVNGGEQANSNYLSSEVFLPSDCGSTGWRAMLDRIEKGRIFVKLLPRSKKMRESHELSIAIDQEGQFTFYDWNGEKRPLDVIVEALHSRSGDAH